jgi:hypothetical protein
MKTQMQKPQTTRLALPPKPQAQPTPPAPRRMTLAAVSSGVVPQPLRVLMYGVGGVGKSTFFSEAPNPIFLDTQAGTSRLDVKRFPRPTTWQDVLDAVDELTTAQHDFQTFVVDLLDDVEALLWAHICNRDGMENVEGYGYGKGYNVACNEWRGLVSRLERLQRERKMAVCFVAHSVIKTFKNPEGEDYDRFSLNLNDRAGGLLRGWCDTVLLARHETVLRTDPKKKRTRGLSTGARIIQTVETAAYYAKNRDSLPDTLPLDWAEFAAACEAKQPAEPSAVRAEIERLLSQVNDDAVTNAVRGHVASSGEDASRLVRILNKLRERVSSDNNQQKENV